VFGNDGYERDTRSRREISFLRGKLGTFGLSEVAFTTDSADRDTWVLVAKVLTPEYHTAAGSDFRMRCLAKEVHRFLWSAWIAACEGADTIAERHVTLSGQVDDQVEQDALDAFMEDLRIIEKGGL
jgi:hypothetical protein